MKTKMMLLVLMAGSSMFAATRFSVGVNVGRVDPTCAAPVYNSYVAPRYEDRDHRDFDRDRDHDRDDRGRGREDDRRYSNDFRRR